MKTKLGIAFALAAIAAFTTTPTVSASAQPATQTVQDEGKKKPRNVKKFNADKKGLALQGYDPVGYFKEGGGKPQKGSDKLTFTHDGLTYRFVSQANLDRFKKNPSKYEPLYGGWCAYAMASDDRVEINPKFFIVTDEGLFVFYKSFLANTKKKWEKEGEAKLKPKADANWTKFLDKK